jgi:hypothetical protein
MPGWLRPGFLLPSKIPRFAPRIMGRPHTVPAHAKP